MFVTVVHETTLIVTDVFISQWTEPFDDVLTVPDITVTDMNG